MAEPHRRRRTPPPVPPKPPGLRSAAMPTIPNKNIDGLRRCFERSDDPSSPELEPLKSPSPIALLPNGHAGESSTSSPDPTPPPRASNPSGALSPGQCSFFTTVASCSTILHEPVTVTLKSPSPEKDDNEDGRGAKTFNKDNRTSSSLMNRLSDIVIGPKTPTRPSSKFFVSLNEDSGIDDQSITDQSTRTSYSESSASVSEKDTCSTNESTIISPRVANGNVVISSTPPTPIQSSMQRPKSASKVSVMRHSVSDENLHEIDRGKKERASTGRVKKRSQVPNSMDYFQPAAMLALIVNRERRHQHHQIRVRHASQNNVLDPEINVINTSQTFSPGSSNRVISRPIITPITYDPALSTDDSGGAGMSTPQNLVAEICTTENMHIRYMKILVEIFPDYIERHMDLTNPKHETEAQIVSTIRKTLSFTIKFHEEFFEDLREVVAEMKQSPETVPRLCEVFEKNYRIDMLMNYNAFISLKADLVNVIDSQLKENAEFRRILEACMKERDIPLNLTNYLDSPWRRLTNYVLMMEQYTKALVKAEYDASIVEEANSLCEKLKSIVKKLEFKISLDESKAALQEIERRVRGVKMDPGRLAGKRVIKQGKVEKHSRNATSPRWLILFNDELWYCHYQAMSYSENSLVIRDPEKHVIDIVEKELMITAGSDNRKLMIQSKDVSFTATLENKGEQDSWLKAFKSVASGDASQQRTSLASETSVNLNDIDKKLPGHTKPVWVEDKNITMCMDCHTVFTYTRRKHHCRGCGKTICKECAGRGKVFYKTEDKAPFLCYLCFDVILEEVHRSVAAGESKRDELELFKTPKNYGKLKTIVSNPSTNSAGVLDDLSDCKINEIEEGYLLVQTSSTTFERRYIKLNATEKSLLIFKAENDPKPMEIMITVGYDFQLEEISDEKVFTLSHENQFGGDKTIRRFKMIKNDYTKEMGWLYAFENSVKV